MIDPRHERDVEAQLTEALPVLGQAALAQALAWLHELLASCSNLMHRRFLIWLWAEGYENFGSVRFGMEGPGMCVWMPEDGAGLALAVGRSVLEVDIRPVTTSKDRYTITAGLIEANPRAAATSLVKHLEVTRAKRERRDR